MILPGAKLACSVPRDFCSFLESALIFQDALPLDNSCSKSTFSSMQAEITA